jgi:hypothetical protein
MIRSGLSCLFIALTWYSFALAGPAAGHDSTSIAAKPASGNDSTKIALKPAGHDSTKTAAKPVA